MKQKIVNLQQKLAQGLVGREQTIKTALLSAVAGENVLLIGPPGTGKSMVSRRISQAIAPKEGASPYFEYLLTKFSTPEELFGPLSISALKQDRFERKTEGYLPDVQVAFLDEIFKASSSILNSLLTILNERKYHNGTESLDIPLQALVAASNELPKGQAELAALYDRFLLRCFVDYLDQNDLSRLFTLPQAADIAPSEQLTAANLADIQAQAREVVFPENIQKVLRDIWQQHAETFKEHADEQLSDRRFVKVLNLLRVSAATNGRSEVDLSDVMLLKDCLWNNDENREKVAELIMGMVKLKGGFEKPVVYDTFPVVYRAKEYQASGTLPSRGGFDSLIDVMVGNVANQRQASKVFIKFKVKKVLAKVGDYVRAGKALVVMESVDPLGITETIKLPNQFTNGGIVKQVKVKVGDVIQQDTEIVLVDVPNKAKQRELRPEEMYSNNQKTSLADMLKENIWL